MSTENNMNTCKSNQEDSNIFKQLEVANILIKNCQIEDAESILVQYSFADLSVGLQIYYKYLQTRLFLAAFLDSGSLSDLLSADTCVDDMVAFAQDGGCKLRNYNYLVIRCICKSKLAVEYNDSNKRAEAKSFAKYLIGIGQSKFPEKMIFDWLMNQLEGNVQ